MQQATTDHNIPRKYLSALPAARNLLAPTLSQVPKQLITVSPARTTTYFYNPKTNELLVQHPFERLTIATTPAPIRPPTPDLGYYSSPATTPTTSPQTKSAKMARTVSFAPPERARDPLCDEKDVMRTFHKHVKHCDTCYNSLSSWGSGEPLCSKGHNYVVDMQPYFFCKAGKPYSLIDRSQKNEMNRVLVPADYKHVSILFEALNAGYSTNPSRRPQRPQRPKVVIHQPAPVIREAEPRRHERPTIVIPTERYSPSHRSPRSGDRHHEERRHREPRYRGSLYHEDERRRHRHDAEIISASPVRYRL